MTVVDVLGERVAKGRMDEAVNFLLRHRDGPQVRLLRPDRREARIAEHRAHGPAAHAVRLDVVERGQHRDFVVGRAANLALRDAVNDEIANLLRVAPDLQRGVLVAGIAGDRGQQVLTAVGHRFDRQHVQNEAVFAQAEEQRHVGHLPQMVQHGFVLEQKTLRARGEIDEGHGFVLVTHSRAVELVIGEDVRGVDREEAEAASSHKAYWRRVSCGGAVFTDSAV